MRTANPEKTSESPTYRTRSWSDIVASPSAVWPWLARLSAFPALGLLAVVVYGLAVDGATVIAVGFIVAGGAFTIGALLGFLFGVPRALSGAAQEPGLRSNTNLEQISDWLTKILVGVGLVEIGQLADSGARLVTFLAPALGDAPSSEAFAGGLLTFFWASGFMIGYVVTRAVVGPLFSQTEWVIQHVEPGSAKEQAAKTATASSDVARPATDARESTTHHGLLHFAVIRRPDPAARRADTRNSES